MCKATREEEKGRANAGRSYWLDASNDALGGSYVSIPTLAGIDINPRGIGSIQGQIPYPCPPRHKRGRSI